MRVVLSMCPRREVARAHGLLLGRRRGGIAANVMPLPTTGISPGAGTGTSHACTTVVFPLYRLSHCRFYSAPASSSSQSSPPSFRNLVKPFLLRCHPDVQTADDAKQVNLKAIQNLNAYLDVIEQQMSSRRARRSNNDMNNNKLVEIDFVIMVHDESRFKAKKKKKQTTMSASRRKVQLAFPPLDLLLQASDNKTAAASLQQFVRYELAKLLRVAGLEVPTELEQMASPSRKEDGNPNDDGNGGNDTDDGLDEWDHMWSDAMELDKEQERMEMWERHYQRRPPPQRLRQPSQYARLARERRRFTNNIDWAKVDVLYQQAWHEAAADMATEGLIRNHRQRRQEFIAQILARVVVAPDDAVAEINVVERFCAMRRLSLILDEHFDRLQLEDCSAMWEQMTIRLTAPRPYNTSPSALHKRRNRRKKEQQQQETGDSETSGGGGGGGGAIVDTGFSFMLHADGKVSAQIPLDFGEEELLQEWDRNLQDFNNIIMGNNGGLDEIFIVPPRAGAAV